MQQSEIAARQFGDAASDYLRSAVHAQGADLAELAAAVEPNPQARLLDLGCGAGHASYAVAPRVGEVCAYDISAQMLQVVAQTASERGLTNVRVRQGSVETLPFEDGVFDAVVSRYSAHHWRGVPTALREARRVLKSSGTLVMIDSMSVADPLCDSHLQAIELLRDRSHVRNYTAGEWQQMLAEAGFEAAPPKIWRLHIEFSSWIARMRTSTERVAAIRHLWQNAPEEVRNCYSVQADFSFELPALLLTANVGSQDHGPSREAFR